MQDENIAESVPKSARRDVSFKANLINDTPLSPRAISDPNQSSSTTIEKPSSRPASSSSRRLLIVEEMTNAALSMSITDQGSVDSDSKEASKPKVVISPRAMAFEASYSQEYPPNLTSENFFYWRSIFPELELLFDNQAAIYEEARNIPQWVPWPEDHFATQAVDTNTKDWTVFPLLHTFPAYDDQRQSWIPSTCNHCPHTTALLKQLPNLRTALFSKLGPGTRLSSHTGWADLANYVLRCHVCLDIPEDGSCGLLVDGEVQYHQQGSIIVFDDSKPHRAFNLSDKWSRTVLIVDLIRPRYIPVGKATGSHTAELDDFVHLFK